MTSCASLVEKPPKDPVPSIVPAQLLHPEHGKYNCLLIEQLRPRPCRTLACLSPRKQTLGMTSCASLVENPPKDPA